MRRPTLRRAALGGHGRHADRMDATRPPRPAPGRSAPGPPGRGAPPPGRRGSCPGDAAPPGTPRVSPRPHVADHVTDEPAQLLKTVAGGQRPSPRGTAPGPTHRLPPDLPRPRRDTSTGRGFGELRSLRFSGGSDDIDLDATLDRLVEHPVPEDDDIIVRERIRTRRSVVLVVDTSGSIRGERVRTAAATVGALVRSWLATSSPSSPSGRMPPSSPLSASRCRRPR